jgi:hypothetical protein
VVVQIGANYFSIRQPDSGLSIASPYDKSVISLSLNPTQIDIRKVNTTISTFTFKLLDADGIISALVLGDAAPLIGQEVRIFIGRSNVAMAFSDYFELPRTFIKKCDHGDNAYSFSSAEQTDRMTKPIYTAKSALGADILISTTTITARDDLADFPTAGVMKIDDEFISYTGVNLGLKQFTGCVRGELNSVPAAHSINTDIFTVETITDNPLNIILKLLISGGGGGTYDTLQSGLGISNALVDVSGIEALRDELFLGVQYTLTLYSIDSALSLIETELLMPNNLRFSNSVTTSKLTLAILDKARYVEDDEIIDEDTITKFPKWAIDGAKVTNKIQIDWDYKEATKVYQKRDTYSDAASISAYGEQSPLVLKFKGIKSTLDGQALVDDFGGKLLARLALPTPEVSINTQIDKSLQALGDKAFLVSSKIPAADGTLNFSSLLEILSRSIDVTKGDVSFKLAFTSFTNIRSGFIAPSDTVVSVISQKKITVASGRGAQYKVGWVMKLWNSLSLVYESDAANTIESIVGDTITFTNNFATTLLTTHKIRFGIYDEVTESQKRFCFLSAAGANFTADNKPTYKVTY